MQFTILVLFLYTAKPRCNHVIHKRVNPHAVLSTSVRHPHLHAHHHLLTTIDTYHDGERASPSPFPLYSSHNHRL